jgi:hypothetical protein
MAATSEARALPFFTDLYGQPLESGSIYIGKPGLDPVAYPVTVFSDADQTVALAQPIRTVHGRAVSAGAQVHMFCPAPYSITILDGAGRIIYASLNEVDPALIAIGNSGVQSAADLSTLRARSGSSTNQVWVPGFGMYGYVPTDNTSPESIPTIIVGNDGSRYYLDVQYVRGNWAHITTQSDNIKQQGFWATWNDDLSGSTFLTNNRGNGTGGFVLRNVDVNNTTETGRVTMTAPGGLVATSDVRSDGNLIAQGGTVALDNAGDRYVRYDGANYLMPAADLFVNGSKAVTQASFSSTLQAALLANQQANGVGSVAVGSASGVNPPTLPGTWATTGANFNNVWQYVRVA